MENYDVKNVSKKRDSFGTRWGFILACIGSAVGMGNIWMFPSRVSLYGGGSFLIPYLFFVIIIGFSGVIGEMSFGRSMKSGPIGAFGEATERAGKGRKLGEMIGIIPVLGSLSLAIGYSVVVGWIIKYMVFSITGGLWNLDGVENFGAEFGATASAFGNVPWHIVGLVLSFIIMIFGIASGIEKANKIMMPLFFIMFLGLGIYIITQLGALEGYRYIFTIDPAALANPKTWIFALGQAFFSLSLAGNGTLVYGSYLDEKEDIISSASNVALFDTLAAMLAALVIIPAMATTGEKLSSGGPGLMFIFIPNLFKGMPGGRILMIVFFIAVLFAGVTSLINLFEAPIETLQNKFGLSRTKSVLIVAVISTAIALCIAGIVGNWMDFVSIYVCPLGAFLAGLMYFWVCGPNFAREQIQKGRAKPIGKWLEPMTKYVFCGLTLIVLVLGIFYGGIG